MLNVIIWKGHYCRHGHWSLQLMGPLLKNHFFPFSSESQIKLKTRLGYGTTKPRGQMTERG